MESKLGMRKHGWLLEKNRKGVKMEVERTPTLVIKYIEGRERVGGGEHVLEV